jgi:hypothetical protein
MPNPGTASRDQKDDNHRKQPSREELIEWILSILPEPPDSKHGDNSPSSTENSQTELTCPSHRDMRGSKET